MTIGQRGWAGIFMLAVFSTSALWGSSAQIGVAGLGAMVVLMVATHRISPAPDELRAKSTIEGSAFEASVVTLIIALPIILQLMTTWRQEFPFVGDHDYHLFQSGASFQFWKGYFLPVTALIAVSMLQLRRKPSSWVAFGSLTVLVVAGWTMAGDLTFSIRYPGTFYFLSVPMQTIASVFEWDSPLNALRLTNALSLPVWLLILRPLLIRKWPDVSLLPAGLFLFYQKDLVYYFATAYLEPWALVLVLLSVEHLVLFRAENAWKVWLILGFGAMIKEQVILVLPFVVAATFDWKSFRTGSGRTSLLLALASVFPFLLYYVLRSGSGIWRSAELAGIREILDAARTHLFFERAWMQFGPSIVLIIAAMVGALVLALVGDRSTRRIFVALLAAAFFQVAFFYADRISLGWTGYPRFHLLPVMLLAAPFLELGRSSTWRKRGLASTIAAAIVIVNSITLIPALGLLPGPDSRRNFTEHSDSPVYFPVEELLGSVDGSGVAAIRVTSNIDKAIPGYRLQALSLAYPRLAERFSFDLEIPRERSCSCSGDSDAVLGLYVMFSNLGEELETRSVAEAEAARCHAEIIATCGKVREVEVDGNRIGTLGVGRNIAGGFNDRTTAVTP